MIIYRDGGRPFTREAQCLECGNDSRYIGEGFSLYSIGGYPSTFWICRYCGSSAVVISDVMCDAQKEYDRRRLPFVMKKQDKLQ